MDQANNFGFDFEFNKEPLESFVLFFIKRMNNFHFGRLP